MNNIPRRSALPIYFPYIALELPPQALEAARRSPLVTSIVEDLPIPADLAQSTPIVQAPTMWANGLTGAGQTIAVLDTGTHTSHPFLAGKVVEEACYSINSNCPNGATTMTGAGSGVYRTYAPDGCQHGTHVAGIAAGQGSNFSGVGKGASIMSVQVFSRFTGAANCGAGEDPCTLSNFSDQITFRCSLDGGPFTSCSPPKVYRTLSRGGHTLRVYAVGAAGETEDRDTTPAVFRWRVVRG